MLFAKTFWMSALLACVIAQAKDAVFEPHGFNVSAALTDHGISISNLPFSTSEMSSSFNKNSVSVQCSLACASLDILYDKDQILVLGEPAYNSFTRLYWSAQQGATRPSCIFKPSKTKDVSILILLARLYRCPFAVKGGGHAAWAGASSIEQGITVSMENFKTIQVSSDKRRVDIGSGLRWVDVYTAIERDGLGVVGGRVAPVGVSGLILGGGISHFASRLGWACDNVASYELVTASGLAINVSRSSYPDLYWGLKGGGNNFGVVTKFELDAFPLGQMWGGQRTYSESSFSEILDAIYQFTIEGSSLDLDAAQIVAFATAPSIGKVAFANLHYAKPIANATVFQRWSNITAIADTTDFRTMSEMAILLNEGAPAAGVYQTWWGISLVMDRHLMGFAVDTFYAQAASIADLDKIYLVMAIQPILEGALVAMQKNGGNALGLDADRGPYFVLNFNAAWNKKEYEPQFHRVISKTISIVEQEARKTKLDNDFIYMNYASEYEDPLNSYGLANKKRLLHISKKYDPAQIFQTLQPGGFKLTRGAPNPHLP